MTKNFGVRYFPKILMFLCLKVHWHQYYNTRFTPGINRNNHVSAKDAIIVNTDTTANLPNAPIQILSNANSIIIRIGK